MSTERPGARGGAAEWFTVRWSDEGVVLLDQRALPERETYLTLSSVEEVARAIEDMVVRGAPAIGCTAAMGVARAALDAGARDLAALHAAVEAGCERLARTRPTAVNLFRALGDMREHFEASAAAPGATPRSVCDALVEKARSSVDEDTRCCRAIGAAGLELVPEDARILTHCNAGALATGGYGTALGIVRAAAAAGRVTEVLADETRPFLQGARLTAWELDRDGIPVTVIVDAMAAHLMSRGEADLVIVGADRIAANGDVANKIGTYGLAVLAREHDLPFYVAAPRSTVDLGTPDGSRIPIEERSPEEILVWGDRRLAPAGVSARHPAFDVTPARLVTAIVTEAGIARPPYRQSLAQLIDSGG